MDPRIILKTALGGGEVTPTEAIVLMQSYPNMGEEINYTADLLNRKINKGVVTYLHSKHILYSNVCRYRCKFCSIFKKRHEKGGFTLKIDSIIKKIKEDPNLEQVCIYGACNPELPFTYYCDLLKHVRKAFPNIHVQAFSPLEIQFIAKRSKNSTIEVLKKFKEAGLDSMSGFDAEILNDKLRKKICPDKMRTHDWVDVIRNAHHLGINTTATILFGHLEDEIHIAEHLEIIRLIQRETHGFTQFIPIPFSMHTTEFSSLRKLASKWRERAGFLNENDAASRLLSVSRLFFGPNLTNIQASWFRLGIDKAVQSLTAGANDLGETTFDETTCKNLNVRSGAVLSPSKIKKIIVKAGKTPHTRSLRIKR
jgi:CofH subfamily radical SAM domain protein